MVATLDLETIPGQALFTDTRSTVILIGVITARKRSLGQGNIFTRVCHSFCPGGVCPMLPMGRPGGWADPLHADPPPSWADPRMQTPWMQNPPPRLNFHSYLQFQNGYMYSSSFLGPLLKSSYWS